jgi:hypothetical protein
MRFKNSKNNNFINTNTNTKSNYYYLFIVILICVVIYSFMNEQTTINRLI